MQKQDIVKKMVIKAKESYLMTYIIQGSMFFVHHE